VQNSSLAALISESSGATRGLKSTGEGGSCSITGEEQPILPYVVVAAPEDMVGKKISGVGRAVSLLTTCYSSSGENEMSLSTSIQIEDLVPPCYIHAGNMQRLIKVSLMHKKLPGFSFCLLIYSIQSAI